MLGEVVRLNPRQLSALNYLGLCYMGLEKFDEAIKYFDSAIRIDPSYRYAHENRVIAQHALERSNGMFGRLFGKH